MLKQIGAHIHQSDYWSAINRLCFWVTVMSGSLQPAAVSIESPQPSLSDQPSKLESVNKLIKCLNSLWNITIFLRCPTNVALGVAIFLDRGTESSKFITLIFFYYIICFTLEGDKDPSQMTGTQLLAWLMIYGHIVWWLFRWKKVFESTDIHFICLKCHVFHPWTFKFQDPSPLLAMLYVILKEITSKLRVFVATACPAFLNLCNLKCLLEHWGSRGMAV